MPIKISICIPVYNCANFLEYALDSILTHTNTQIEVIVFDGASTDRTPDLMNDYTRHHPNLIYYRSSSRGGIDADLASCVNLAQGEYVWLFSGDDVMRPDAIEKAITLLSYNYDIYICKHTLCNKKMDILKEYPSFISRQAFSCKFNRSEFKARMVL